MVSETQHTPGPWEVSVGRKDGDWSKDDVMTCSNPSKRICNVYGGLAYPPGLANARLIAAAPDLLAACQKLLAIAGELPPETEAEQAAMDVLILEAKAAIANANGDPT